jgi:hypothetical protein
VFSDLEPNIVPGYHIVSASSIVPASIIAFNFLKTVEISLVITPVRGKHSTRTEIKYNDVITNKVVDCAHSYLKESQVTNIGRRHVDQIVID